MRLLVNAVITGFGLKLGADIYKYVKGRLGFPEDEKSEMVDAGRAAEQS